MRPHSESRLSCMSCCKQYLTLDSGLSYLTAYMCAQTDRQTDRQTWSLYQVLYVRNNRKLFSIKVPLRAFQTETLTLTFNPMRATVMTHTHAKGQGQRSLGSIVSENKQMESIALSAMVTRSANICHGACRMRQTGRIDF